MKGVSRWFDHLFQSKFGVEVRGIGWHKIAFMIGEVDEHGNRDGETEPQQTEGLYRRSHLLDLDAGLLGDNHLEWVA